MSQLSENVSKLVTEINKLPSGDRIVLLLEVFKNFNLLDLKEFKDAFCTTFGVSAVAPMMGVSTAATSATIEAAPKVEEPTEFNVVLTGSGNKKIQVIKVVRTITGLGLKEAKDLVEASPKAVKEKVSKEEAEKMKKDLEEAGGTVEIKGV